MNIKKLAGHSHAVNVSQGFWQEKGIEGERLFLVTTELAECCEADRKSHVGDLKKYEAESKRIENSRYSDSEKVQLKSKLFEKHVKNCIGDELADAFIRMLDYCVGFRVEIDEPGIKREAIRMKSKKLGNLGTALLELSGMIEFLHKGITKRTTAKLILARIMWLAERLDVPLNKHVKYKLEYNSTRPRKHNKRY